jgi:hypothetical protein
MKILTEDAVLVCTHRGIVRMVTSQKLVRVDERIVLVDNDPEGRDIDRCPNRNLAGMKPCLKTLKVRAGYSTLMRIDGKAICLETISGLTNGSPPGTVEYLVRKPGQELVTGSA